MLGLESKKLRKPALMVDLDDKKRKRKREDKVTKLSEAHNKNLC